MTYRIRIMRLENGVLVFDRYATEIEMAQLRISSDGKVEKLNACEEYDNTWKKQKHTFPLHSCNNYYQTTVCGFWQDVSATHFVEWGEDVDDLRTRIEILTKAYESLPELIVSLDSGDLYDANNLSKVLDEHLKQMESK